MHGRGASESIPPTTIKVQTRDVSKILLNGIPPLIMDLQMTVLLYQLLATARGEECSFAFALPVGRTSCLATVKTGCWPEPASSSYAPKVVHKCNLNQIPPPSLLKM